MLFIVSQLALILLLHTYYLYKYNALTIILSHEEDILYYLCTQTGEMFPLRPYHPHKTNKPTNQPWSGEGWLKVVCMYWIKQANCIYTNYTSINPIHCFRNQDCLILAWLGERKLHSCTHAVLIQHNIKGIIQFGTRTLQMLFTLILQCFTFFRK